MATEQLSFPFVEAVGTTPQSGLACRTLPQSLINLLAMLAGGYTLRQAAAALGISHQVAKNRMHRIKDELDADTMTQAIYLAVREGLIE